MVGGHGLGGDLGVNKKGTPLYSREDIREQYCINDKELQVLDKWPLGDGIWGWADSIILNVTDLQTSATTWFSTEVTVFGRTMERTGLLGWPFVFINVVIVIGGFVSRRRLRGDDETAELATDAEDKATDAVGTVEPA